jgi:predicted enzyme related to lactoylglutathione lyase
MGQPEVPSFGAIAWTDLTVPDAESVRDFYKAFVGWEAVPVPMGGYADYQMNAAGTDQPVAGVCHTRGVNADLPPQWLIYVTVADMDASIAACTSRGGSVVAGPRGMGVYGRFCVIRDPAGAVLALLEAPRPSQQLGTNPKEP